MHPLLAHPRQLAIYLALWVPLGLLLAGTFGLTQPGPWSESLAVALPLALVYGFHCLTAWYVVRAVPATGESLGRPLATGATAAAISALGWLAAGVGWSELLAVLPRFAGAATRFRGAAALFFACGTLLFALALLLHHLMMAFERSRESERRTLEAQVLAGEAELRALKAQLDPHFLFNSLNSVSALTGSDPAAARRMCLLLAGFFRKSLKLGRTREIPLGEELYLAETYLAIEEVRFGERLRVVTDIAEDTLALAVPPLVLQPLVENAVHHGVAHLLEGGEVRLAARRRGSRLELEVENRCDPDRPPSRGAGVGLANVRARLEAIFGREATVLATPSPDRYRVQLSLPARPAPTS